MGCVCVCGRAPLVPCHSWLGCAMWLYLLGLAFRLRPATPGWGVGVCVCLCACSACTRHSWLGCAVWSCVLGLGFHLRPALLARLLGCVCRCAPSACKPPFLAGICDEWVCGLAVAWHLFLCRGSLRVARFPGLRRPVAVVAWLLSVCLGCRPRRASVACLVALLWCAAPRLVWSLSVLRSALLNAMVPFLHPRGLRPRIYWATLRSMWRPAENRARCACR